MEERRRKRRTFSEEFKEETVRLVREGGKSLTEVARDLELTRSAVERWGKEAEDGAGRGPAGAGTRGGRKGRAEVWREKRPPAMGAYILKKTAGFFAKEHA